MVEPGPPTAMGQREESLTEKSSHASRTGMLSTHTSPCMQERRELTGLLLKTLVEQGEGIVSSLLHSGIQVHIYKTVPCACESDSECVGAKCML